MSSATRRSQASASSSPPPNATPCSAATDGFGLSARASSASVSRWTNREVMRPIERVELGDVGAGAEGLALAGDHDGAHRVVAPENGDCLPERQRNLG